MTEEKTEALIVGLKNLIKGFLSKSLNLSEEEIESALFNAEGTEVNATAFDYLKSKYATHIEELSGTADAQLLERYNTGVRKGMEGFEDKLKKKYKITSGKVGLELVEELLTKFKGNTEKLTDEAVKNHKAYVELVESQDARIAEAVQAAEQKFEADKAKWNREKAMSEIMPDALSHFYSMKPVLSKKKEIADNQILVFKNAVEAFDYDRSEGKITIKKGDEIQKNEFGHRLEFTTHIENIAKKYFDFDDSDGREVPPAGDGGVPGSGGSKTVLRKPKSDEEYVQMFAEIETNPAFDKATQYRLKQELTKLHTEPAK
jgi:hypothetical protein